MNRSSWLRKMISLPLCIVVLLTAIVPQAAMAQPVSLKGSQKARSNKVRLKLPKLPPGDPPAGRRRGGGGRDTCPDVVVPVTALVPATTRSKNGKVIEDVWGLTTLEKPNFWIYSPYNQGDRFKASFVIRQKNKHGNIIDSLPVQLPARPGLLKVTLPEKMPALQTNQSYYWEFLIDCREAGKGVPLKVEGMVQRVDLSETAKQQVAAELTPIGKAQQYAENGIWFEALDLLSGCEQNEPNLKSNWEELLRSVNLDPTQFGR
ncbi:DUF928 domain-containing protein [Alkalinema pantanalense CENA528]|uniref:DUF928 domain-containing protein n=1 Tax=Alkalinema pantanalense TaxID=1620705 RepID=UPI003D6DC8B3